MQHRSGTHCSRLIIISGYDCSGKSTLAKTLARKGDAIIEAGQVVRDELGLQRGVDLTKKYTTLQEQLNKTIITETRRIHSNISHLDCSVFLVGVRSISLFKELTIQYPNSTSYFVDTPRHLRYMRHISEKRLQKPFTYRQFTANDLTQREWGIEIIKSSTNYVIRANLRE